MPGFVRSAMMYVADNPIFVTSTFTVKECGRKCLSLSNCDCFGYDFESKLCQLNNGVCEPSNASYNTSYIYNKIASKFLTCRPIDCGGNIQIGSHTLKTCQDSCTASLNCNMFVYKPFEENRQCRFVNKSENCDFNYLKENINKTAITCVKGPIQNNDWNPFDVVLKNVTDTLYNTCIDVSSTEGFSLRIPWPSIESENPNFRLLIKGKNLRKCFQSYNDTTLIGIFAYIPEEIQFNTDFNDYFVSCQLLSGNGLDLCEYRCLCGKDHCQAAYIKAYTNDQINMKICGYVINT